MNAIIEKRLLKAKIRHHRNVIDNANLAFIEGKISERKRNAIMKSHSKNLYEYINRYHDLYAFQIKTN